MNDNVTEMPKTIRQQAEEDLAHENAKRALGKMKAKLGELQKAQQVVANIERELADLEEAIEQGNDV